MKDMDKYWKSVGSLFDSKDNRKVIWIGYAVGLVLVTASIFTLCLRLLRYEEFTFGRMSSLIFRGHKTKRIFKREPENGGRT